MQVGTLAGLRPALNFVCVLFRSGTCPFENRCPSACHRVIWFYCLPIALRSRSTITSITQRRYAVYSWRLLRAFKIQFCMNVWYKYTFIQQASSWWTNDSEFKLINVLCYFTVKLKMVVKLLFIFVPLHNEIHGGFLSAILPLLEISSSNRAQLHLGLISLNQNLLD